MLKIQVGRVHFLHTISLPFLHYYHIVYCCYYYYMLLQGLSPPLSSSSLSPSLSQILRPDGSMSNGGTPAVSINVPNSESPPPTTAPVTTSRPNQRQRRKGGPLPQITETLDDSKPSGLLQVKDHIMGGSGKRHSLTPESSRREMIPIQPSKSLDLGALPTWRNKTFITLNNYVTGEQQTDRLHTQVKPVSGPLFDTYAVTC